MIRLGTHVRDRVSGFTGVVENRASFLHGCDRYCVQPMVGADGKMPDSAMVDEPQLEVLDCEPAAMPAAAEPVQYVQLGAKVTDAIRGLSGVAIGRAVYLNGCARILIQPRHRWWSSPKVGWVDEAQISPPPACAEPKTGGPAPASSKR